jgi:hypothetical protein
MNVRFVALLSPDPAPCVAERFVREEARIGGAATVTPVFL